jgi:hypothetical protein
MRCAEIPLIKSRATSMSGTVYQEYRKLEKIGHMGHVREYTPLEVGEFLYDVGFTVETMICRGGDRRRSLQPLLRVMPSLRPYATYIARRRPVAPPET